MNSPGRGKANQLSYWNNIIHLTWFRETRQYGLGTILDGNRIACMMVRWSDFINLSVWSFGAPTICGTQSGRRTAIQSFVISWNKYKQGHVNQHNIQNAENSVLLFKENRNKKQSMQNTISVYMHVRVYILFSLHTQTHHCSSWSM